MRDGSRIHSNRFLYVLLAAASLGCSCKSVESRVSEDRAAMTGARQEIRSKAKEVLTKREKDLDDEHTSVIGQLRVELDNWKKDNEAKQKEIEDLKKRIPPPTPYPTPPRFR